MKSLFGNPKHIILIAVMLLIVFSTLNGAHAGTHYENDSRIAEVRQTYDTSSVVQLIVVDVASSGGISGRGTGIKQRGAVILYRRWNRDTTIHELGHAFGLQHDFRDDAYVMSYGGSRSSLSAGAAHFLAVNPYFNSSVPFQAGSAPSNV